MVIVLDGRASVVEEVAACGLRLRSYLAEKFQEFIKDDSFLAAVQGNLPRDPANQARLPALLDRIRTIGSLT